MRITYDPRANAAYIYLTERVDRPDTRPVTDDVYIDLDEEGSLVGIEVLDASEHLDLDYLLPLCQILGEEGRGWHKLREELWRRKQAGLVVETQVQSIKYCIEKIGDDYVVVRSERSGNLRKITRQEIEDGAIEKNIGKRRIILALREIGRYA